VWTFLTHSSIGRLFRQIIRETLGAVRMHNNATRIPQNAARGGAVEPVLR
jgi:hypothetical protein